MKPWAVLVNASRGPVIDEAALVKHLQKSPDFRSGMHHTDCHVPTVALWSRYACMAQQAGQEQHAKSRQQDIL